MREGRLAQISHKRGFGQSRFRLRVEKLVPPTRIERATRGLGNRCSIQLSYGGILIFSVPYTTAADPSRPESGSP